MSDDSHCGPKVPKELRRYTLDPDWTCDEQEEERRRRALEEFRKQTRPPTGD
jgi:hypothetical protein